MAILFYFCRGFSLLIVVGVDFRNNIVGLWHLHVITFIMIIHPHNHHHHHEHRIPLFFKEREREGEREFTGDTKR